MAVESFRVVVGQGRKIALDYNGWWGWSAIVVVVVVVGSTGLHPLYSPLPKALPAQLIQTAYNFKNSFLNSSWQSIDLFVEKSHFARVF